jgi:murein DD-endopeptidase MepM/ murein hydrolase activator NlpD
MRFHKGLDLAAPEGTPVRAALGGEVVYAGYDGSYGNTVVIRHGDGLQTRYAHLEATDVKRGDLVTQEQVLGKVGSTGHSTGPHLHFEVIRDGERIDPGQALAD